MIFWTKFAQKWCFRSKTGKVNTNIEFYIIELVLVPIFSLLVLVPIFRFKWQFWFFGPSLAKKGISCQKRKSQQHYWILHIRISPVTKFQITLTLFLFVVLVVVVCLRFSLNKFAQKGYFRSKTEKTALAPESMVVTYYIKL